MSSFHAWQVAITLKPSQRLKYFFYGFCLLAAVIVLYGLWVSFYFLLLLSVILLLLRDIYQRFVVLQHPEAIVAIRCDNGFWSVYRGSQDELSIEKGFILDEFFLSSSLIVLSLKQTDAFFVERIIIFRDQLPLDAFRLLLVSLKFQRADIFVNG